MNPRSHCLLLILACLAALPAPAHATPCELRLTDFEDHPSLGLTGEGVRAGSAVELVNDAPDATGVALRLTYDFVADPGGLQYVGFHTPAALVGRPTAFSLRVYGDGSGEPLRLRLTDATGETFQYGMPDITWMGWQRVTIPLATDQVHWTGNADGKWDLPVHLDSVLVDSVRRPREGTVWFDDLSYTTDAEPVDLVAASIESEAFGGVAWGPDAPLAGALSLTNATVDRTLAGSADVRLTGPRGQELGTVRVDFALGPGDRSRTSLPPPGTQEGLVRVDVTLTVGGQQRSLSSSFARFLAAQPDAQDPSSFFGVTTHFGQGKGNNPGTFDLMSRAGIKWLRDEISWGSVETEKGKYRIPDWADRYMQGAVAHGIAPLIILDYGNGFYDGGASPTSPEAQAAFGEYCFQLVSHLKGICKTWEVYNEPNIGFWQPKPDPEAYTRLLKIAYRRCKEADPTCTVVGVCTAGTDLNFIEEVLKRGGMDSMDALSVHPYRYPGAPESTGFVAELTRAHELMARYGGGDKKLWLTEIGWPTHTTASGVSEVISGDYYARMHTQALSLPFVERVFWYDFQDDGLDSAYNEHNFGLIRWETFTPKANYVAARVTAGQLTGASFVRQLLPADAQDRRYCYLFQREGRPVIAAWADGVAESVALKVSAPRVELQWTDAQREIRETLDGVLSLTLTDMPVFITGGQGEVAPAAPPVGLEVSPLPLAPGENASVRVTVPEGARPMVEVTPGLPISRPFPSGTHPGLYRFRVSSAAAPTTGALTVRALDGRGREVGTASTTLRIVTPLEVTFEAPRAQPDGSVTVSARLRNTRELPLALRSYQISGGRGGIAGEGPLPARLEPGQQVTLPEVATLSAAIPGAARTVVLNVVTASGATVSRVVNMGLWEVPRAVVPPTVDGDPADWPMDAAAGLGGRPTDFVALRPGAWTGPEDLSARLRLRWDGAALYLLVEVQDDAHVQVHHGAEVWQSDNIQLALDDGLRAWRARDDGKPTAYPELGLSRTDTGDEVMRWLWRDGVPAEVKLATSRSGNITVYEASIPWKELAARAPRPGALAGFSLLINEDDGQSRDGWLEQFSGIGYAKDPRQFGVLRFAG